MKIKTKLNFSVGALFGLIIVLAGVSMWYINSLKQDTNNILIANYNTLEYSRNMSLALDDWETAGQLAWDNFEDNLSKQRKNETEIGENQATQTIVEHFERLKKDPEDLQLRSAIRRDIAQLMQLNMQAIERKSHIASETAESATIWIALTGTLCFVIAFTLLINLPNNIVNPIEELTESIRQIAAQNYHQRVHFESHSEFGTLAQSFNTMAIKLEEYAESKLGKILKEKRRIETLINKMSDPVIGLDENKRVLFVNNEALAIIGLKSSDLVGQTIQDIAVRNDLIRLLIQDLIVPMDLSGPQEPIKIFAHDKESYFEKEIIDIEIQPTGESKYELIGYVILLKNITMFKELDFAKTNFIATVSHELKTPLSSIKMSLELLKNERIGPVNADQRSLMESIGEDANRLLRTTGELLNITQVEMGQTKLDFSICSVAELVAEALESNRGQAALKNIQLRWQCDADLPELQVDREKTIWIISNVISNALRYSYENSEIHLSASWVDQLVQLSVKDHGQGIPANYLSRIFDKYFRVPDTLKEGTGLGLSISKEFMEAQGGTIKVASTPGDGSCFTLYFKTQALGDRDRSGSLIKA